MIFIESKENNLFKETKKLKERKNRVKNNRYIIEGFRLIQEAFKANVNIEYVMVTSHGKEKMASYLSEYISKDIKMYEITDSLFNELIYTEKPQGIIAVINMENKSIDSDGKFYLLCDKIQDPGNLGTIIRTAHSVKVDGIILTKGTVDIYNEKTIRSTMGSIFYVPIYYDDKDLSLTKSLINEDFKVITTSLETDKDFFQEDLKGKVVLAVGNEGNGVSDEVFAISNVKVKIPMPGNAESLNVAVASSVIMYEKLRQDIYN